MPEVLAPVLFELLWKHDRAVDLDRQPTVSSQKHNRAHDDLTGRAESPAQGVVGGRDSKGEADGGVCGYCLEYCGRIVNARDEGKENGAY